MRVTVVGATGNVGTSLLRSLVDDPQISSIVGVARREPSISLPKTEWVAADIVTDDLVPIFEGSDVVVHLAWLIQPSHRREVTWRVNQAGTKRVFDAAAVAACSALVYASSIGAYSPGPKEYGIDESWPTGGVPTSFYSIDKAATERMLDAFEDAHPSVRVVRLRPGLIFKREAASGVRRLFAGPLLPNAALHPALLPVVPDIPNLRFQCLHSFDVAEAYRLAITTDAQGAFNVAADPVLDPGQLAELLGARLVKVSQWVVRGFAHATWRLHLQPTPVGWVDLAFQTPIMEIKRAREDLGWTPRWTSKEALMDLLGGLHDGADYNTPPLAAETSGPARIKEFATGIGVGSGVRKD